MLYFVPPQQYLYSTSHELMHQLCSSNGLTHGVSHMKVFHSPIRSVKLLSAVKQLEIAITNTELFAGWSSGFKEDQEGSHN